MCSYGRRTQTLYTWLSGDIFLMWPRVLLVDLASKLLEWLKHWNGSNTILKTVRIWKPRQVICWIGSKFLLQYILVSTLTQNPETRGISKNCHTQVDRTWHVWKASRSGFLRQNPEVCLRNSKKIWWDFQKLPTAHLVFVVWSRLTLVESLGVVERNAFRGRLTNNTSTRPSHTHNFIIIQVSRTWKLGGTATDS